mmetsp:Transcript_29320/g.47553  ORF Transcript_29320/g.47553 Transcript_29320/m.47553 type:complete len:505 (-) Transcript_29320:129-1643(-)|eukprot:scaffold790_cov149-Skeletonema_menzelii.AAC.17
MIAGNMSRSSLYRASTMIATCSRQMVISSGSSNTASLARRRCGSCSWRQRHSIGSNNNSIGEHQRRMMLSTTSRQINTKATPKSQQMLNQNNRATTTTTIRTILSEATLESLLPRSPTLRHLVNTLNTSLLKQRSLPLPRYISPQHYSFTLSECFGHASFILVAASYATEDFLQLRIMAVFGSGAMLLFTYFHPHGRVLWLPLKWNLLFIALNSYRIGRVLFKRYMADQLPEEWKNFRQQHLTVLDPVDFYKLFRIAKEETFEEGDVVMIQGTANPKVRIVIEGELEVLRDGTLTYVLEKGNFVSESGLHSGLLLSGSMEACGSIVVGPPFDPSGKNNVHTSRRNKVRTLTWDRTELVQLLEADKGLRNSLKACLSWDIVRKLKTQRHMLVEGRVKDPTSWTKKREDQGISRYAAILQNMLRLPPEELQAMSQELNKYRLIHHIDDADHERALAKCGWTKEEFRLGRQEKQNEFEDDDDMDEFESVRWRKVRRFSSKVVRTLLQ